MAAAPRATPTVADDPRWARIVARDKAADGRFWYSVSTTGVYCRPSCPSRVANPKNVQLHDTLESAKATGFRPCKPCNPDGPSINSENATLVAKACRIIEESEEEPSLEKLADAIGRSPGYFHRTFKAATRELALRRSLLAVPACGGQLSDEDTAASCLRDGATRLCVCARARAHAHHRCALPQSLLAANLDRAIQQMIVMRRKISCATKHATKWRNCIRNISMISMYCA